MSTFVDLLPQTLGDLYEPAAIEVEREEYCQTGPVVWNSESFAEEQIRGLVRRYFFQDGQSLRIRLL